jgi:hypothetical protein
MRDDEFALGAILAGLSHSDELLRVNMNEQGELAGIGQGIAMGATAGAIVRVRVEGEEIAR